ncbi:synaptic vesicle 2-related protein-like isoform X2 [Takifugu rubripes]|uniref:synaptic vesicle 2-related protein-like isoform X2 n=1 Tax=Takifugu rubripes TaxID=31033 RepID=UPI001145C3C5|nr:synaptic vesicle 2-related protein-like isoform X2 [Takifugu rubripes]
MGNEVLMSHSRSLGFGKDAFSQLHKNMEMTKKRGKPEMRLERGENPEDQVPAAAPITGTLTVDDVLEYIGFGKFHWRISFINGLAWVADAMEIIIMTILSPQLRCEWRLESYQVALMSSVVFLAMGIGAPIWGIFCDKYGRRNGLAICACSILYFGVLSAFAPRYSWFVFLRFLVGFGIGGTPQALTVYSEFLPMTLRGRCLTLLGLFWAFGSMLEVLLALFIMPTLGWRWLLGLSAIPTGIFLIVNNWLPESPRFDMLSGRTAKALETLRYVAKQNRKPMPEAKIVTFKEDNRGQIKDLFTPEIRRTTLLLSFIWFSGIFCYYGIVMLTPSLLQSGDSCMDVEAMAGPACGLQCKYLTSDDYRHILWTSFADVPGPILLVFLLDRIGRKKSFAICFLMFSLFVLPMYACLRSTTVTSLILVTRAVSTTLLQVCYVYTPEVFPTQTRALGFGFCAGFGKIGSLISPFVSEVMRSFSLYLTLSVYCGISLLAAIASLMLPIETQGKRLEETNQNQDAKVTTTTGDYTFFSGERE